MEKAGKDVAGASPKIDASAAVSGIERAVGEFKFGEQSVQDKIAKDSLDAETKQVELLEQIAGSIKKPQELMDKGVDLTKSMRTPTEVYTDKIKELEKLLEAAAISQETFSRAMEKAGKDVAGASPKIDASAAVSGIERAVGEFKFGEQSVQDKIAKDSLDAETKQVELLEQIAGSIKKPQQSFGVLT